MRIDVERRNRITHDQGETVNHLALISLPNSGSTWLAACIARHIPPGMPGHGSYCMEFFNPLRNEEFERHLQWRWGCETQSHFRNIAVGDSDDLDRDLASTWLVAGHAFTKEVFSPFKLAFFARHFHTFVLLRGSAGVFPPQRLRIWSFYEHAWFAINERHPELIEPGQDETVRQRAVRAHHMQMTELSRAARQLGVPVLWFTDLYLDRPLLTARLQACLGWTSPALLDEIESTRDLGAREFRSPRPNGAILGLPAG